MKSLATWCVRHRVVVVVLWVVALVGMTALSQSVGTAYSNSFSLPHTESTQALDLLQANYHAGLVAYSDVLASDVQFHQATLAYLAVVGQRHQDTVALFVALGGGWWNAPKPAGHGDAP